MQLCRYPFVDSFTYLFAGLLGKAIRLDMTPQDRRQNAGNQVAIMTMDGNSGVLLGAQAAQKAPEGLV